MDLLQKYTEAKNFYELDESVILTLEDLDLKLATLIVLKIESAVKQIKEKSKRSQSIGGVIELEEPVYFSLKFIYEKGESPYFFQIYNITSDEYLDLYNLNKIIK